MEPADHRFPQSSYHRPVLHTSLRGRIWEGRKFKDSSWQERSPHPQLGLNKRPSDITSCCRLQNSPGLPTSDHKVPGHAGPNQQGYPAQGALHTLKQLKQKASGQEGPSPKPPSQRAWPHHPCPPGLEAPRPHYPSASPCPSANPMEPLPRPACGKTPPGPTRTPHHSHCFKSSRHKAMRAGWGSETQRPGRDRRRRGSDKEQREGATGDRAEKQGNKILQAEEKAQR